MILSILEDRKGKLIDNKEDELDPRRFRQGDVEN